VEGKARVSRAAIVTNYARRKGGKDSAEITTIISGDN
jgi:hypothetical protein